MHNRNSNFKHKTKRLQISQKVLYHKFYVHDKILNLSKIYFPKIAKKTCKPNNRDLIAIELVVITDLDNLSRLSKFLGMLI